jgi:uncharacterized protein (TIGR03437 family)
MTISGSGSFKFVYPWYVHIAAQPGQGPGVYNGTMTLSNSTFALDNKAIAVTMNVTNSPIAQAPPAINLRLAQGAPPLAPPYTAVPLTITNSGLGTLTVTSVTPTINPSCSSSWLTVTKTSTGASLTVDPTGLSPGTCSATLAVVTNAVNTLPAIPVNLTVVAKGTPTINYQGVTDNATYAFDTVSQGDILIVKGEQFSFAGTTTGGYTPGVVPLQTTLGGASVLVNGTPAPLFYAFYGQLAFQMPFETAVGNALVQVKRDDGSVSNPALVPVASKAPKLLPIGVGNYGAIVNATQSGTGACGGLLCFPLPEGVFPGQSHPAHVGDVLTIYAIGMGQTSPAVATGGLAPSAPPLAQIPDAVTVAFDIGVPPIPPVNATPTFVGMTPGSAGLYQINVQVPDGAPTGIIYVIIGYPDNTVSNRVQIAVQ